MILDYSYTGIEGNVMAENGSSGSEVAKEDLRTVGVDRQSRRGSNGLILCKLSDKIKKVEHAMLKDGTTRQRFEESHQAIISGRRLSQVSEEGSEKILKEDKLEKRRNLRKVSELNLLTSSSFPEKKGITRTREKLEN
ncbi:hypothetical protein RB195_013323 [Necator americanus]|uniref:Uncharacterized protein n=1 Tax=Necator americanus TaxID=51031 RepID=A0ABR1DUY4_NECAM